MKTIREFAVKWDLSERTVNDLCRKGRIDGAVKQGRSWVIPDNAARPADGRKASSSGTDGRRRQLPIGISDFVRAQRDYYYVDKTLLIKEILDRKPFVSLFTRPRRFGKTLNMDMLRVFFEKTNADTSIYFSDKKIWKCGQEYRSHQGQYPVVFLTFKDVKYNSWNETFDRLRSLIQEEYGRHQVLLQSPALSDFEKTYFSEVLQGRANEVQLSYSLERLTSMLSKHYGKAPVVIIDEYDTPIQEGYSKDFYNEIVLFMRNLFSGAFKDNSNLSFGFLTGILRISQESLFSGLNNISVYSVLDSEFESHFGFTEEEVADLLEYYGASDRFPELKAWYDGYLFGSKEIYNPWSVLNYVSRGFIAQAYWANTGRNEILEDVLKTSGNDVSTKLQSLMNGDRVLARIDQNVVFSSLFNDSAYVYSLLFVAGYLKIISKTLQADGSFLCEVSIPNREILCVYRTEILSHLLSAGAVARTTADDIAEGLFLKDLALIQRSISKYLNEVASFYDAGSESFYHGLVLGLISMLGNQYQIRSNRESGDGRYDICLFPRQEGIPGIVIELKWGSGLSDQALEALASSALSQITEKRYFQELREGKSNGILCLGMAFSGKKVCIRSNEV